jgi:phosphoribosyl-AMP cyclohydrolase
MTSADGQNDPIQFGKDGLVPVVIQDANSDAVLMTAFMNEEALRLTRQSGRTHFWSRSRGKLWRKGESSGHEQIVDEIFVNCEMNSLLITVRQIGAACHTGYPTCYFRRLEDDDSLTLVRERWFDPSDVYESTGESLAERTKRWYGAYEFLRDNHLTSVSGTSQRLRDAEADAVERVADELRELAGVLSGTHQHADLTSDALLEGTQSLYWLVLVAVKAELTWEEIRPDRALVTSDESVRSESAAVLLEAEAKSWQVMTARFEERGTLAARIHAAIALVAQACRSAGVSGVTLINHDLEDLRARPYLARYFEVPT